MSLTKHLVPNNTVAAQATALNALYRFLNEEDMSADDVHRAILSAPDGRAIAVVMDKFAIFLAFGDSTRGAKLAANTVAGYFGHVKMWLLSRYPQYRATTEKDLQVVSARLNKYCKKRSGGDVVNKAPACRKSDLQALVRCAYMYGMASSDYKDAMLLVWLWHLFGRSSDLSGLSAASIDIYPGGAFYVRFTRPKTAEDAGLSMFRDKESILTCPINALAVALVMESGKPNVIFNQIPQPAEAVESDNDLLSIPLRDLLTEEAKNLQRGIAAALNSTSLSRISGIASPAVHGHVNRLLSALYVRSDDDHLREKLTSHSFRRGGAQHANGNAKLSPQWILDRGSWSMSATNKAFAYIVNTSQEDQRVAKCLSGWEPDEPVQHLDLSPFDPVVQAKIRHVQNVLFSGCDGVDQQVLETLMATVLSNFPEMAEVQKSREDGFVGRVRQCLAYCGVSESEFMIWHHFIRARGLSKTVDTSAPSTTTQSHSDQHSGSDPDLVRLLLEQNRMLLDRLEGIEALLREAGLTPMPVTSLPRVVNGEAERGLSRVSQKRGVRKAARKALREMWVEWRTSLPPRWSESSPLSRQDQHEYRVLVACMSLFLHDGFILRPEDPDFVASVIRYGAQAETQLLAFLAANGIDAKALGTIVRAVRDLYKAHILDGLIAAYIDRVQRGSVVDHLPMSFHAHVVLRLLPRSGVQ